MARKQKQKDIVTAKSGYQGNKSNQKNSKTYRKVNRVN
jgi:hypothetical protein